MRTDPQETKQAVLIAMLRAPNRATLAELVDAIGWQPHSVRGAMSAALKKKLGLTIETRRPEPRGRVYRPAETSSRLDHAT
jgi:hypothetical protein